MLSYLNYALDVLPYAFAATAVLLGVVLALRWVIGSFSTTKLESQQAAQQNERLLEMGHRPPTQEEVEALKYINQQESGNLCPCGEPATHPAPKLIRKRTSWLQKYFAMAPAYKRVIPRPKIVTDWSPELMFCETHAHVADSMMDQFIYQDIRASQSKLNEQVAIRAASFEKEGLMQKIKDSLTEEQKKKVRTITTQSKRLRAVNGDSFSP